MLHTRGRPLVAMHVARFPADAGFIHCHLATKKTTAFGLQGKTQTVLHEHALSPKTPSGQQTLTSRRGIVAEVFTRI